MTKLLDFMFFSGIILTAIAITYAILLVIGGN